MVKNCRQRECPHDSGTGCGLDLFTSVIKHILTGQYYHHQVDDDGDVLIGC